MDTKIVIPTKEQIEWSNCEMGAMIHLDIPIYAPGFDWRENFGNPLSSTLFNPKKLNTDQWVKSAAEAGLKYMVLVAKHCTGFCLWPTEAYDYSVKNTPYKNGKYDIVLDFVNSCKKYDIKPGLYYSASCNGYFSVDNPGTVASGDADEQKRYNAIVEQQLTELWTRYGDLFEIWFDGGCLPVEMGGPDIPSLLHKYQPNAVVFQGPVETRSLIRWVGNENGVAPENCWSTVMKAGDSYIGNFEVDGLTGNPHGNIWSPGECDVPLRTHQAAGGGWMWGENEGKYVYSAEHFLGLYHQSVGRNTNLLIGLVVDADGLVPQKDVEVLKEFGDKVKNLTKNKIAELFGNTMTYTMEVKKAVKTVIIMEDISHGQRVLDYTVSGTSNGNCVALFSGKSIGYKHTIDLKGKYFDEITFTIVECKDTPYILSFAAYE